MSDAFDLDRFVRAQAQVYEDALDEILDGRKTSHWMWFVFPQLAGLGRSEIAQRYAIRGLDEARAYLAHPLLGERLRECTQALLRVEGRSAHDIFGSPDDMKLHSSLTLFSLVAEPGSAFERALGRYFGGVPDQATLRLLQ